MRTQGNWVSAKRIFEIEIAWNSIIDYKQYGTDNWRSMKETWIVMFSYKNRKKNSILLLFLWYVKNSALFFEDEEAYFLL